ncbi:MOSC domain-containing protein [Ktedonobacter robiniae]|uniref:MOSC domain-containing protein n=1 Tax=Ktedonobacter robiniae TaxID=2778365 RepID=A0ABQ3UWG8_9CHLR|nr:MOSC N-terminal beta barrel domain-containing protein [Ktedonobacter robiniae]GHO57176.1 MOSC domain-containing protein [Ktedonobacter robiniae]
MSDFFLRRIRIYPIKACAGTDIQRAYVDMRGLRYDRRWMLVNEQGRDLHQFDHPRLASVVVTLDDDGLFIQAPGMPLLHIPLQPQHSTSRTVQWHQGICEALPVSDQADEWFQDFLHVPCQLVFMPENAQHPVEPGYEVGHDLANFTSFHYHLLGEGSLEDLNQRLEKPVSLERFRPNLVIAGTPAFAEDSWRTIRINQQLFHVVKPCDRCAITTVDPVLGVMTGKEPMTTLARYRTFHKKVLFGQYLLSQDAGMLQVGDRVEVVEQQTPLMI